MRTTLLLCLGLSLAQPAAHAQTGTKQITLEDLYKKGTFRMKGVPGFNAMKDGKRYTQIENDGKAKVIAFSSPSL